MLPELPSHFVLSDCDLVGKLACCDQPSPLTLRQQSEPIHQRNLRNLPPSWRVMKQYSGELWKCKRRLLLLTASNASWTVFLDGPLQKLRYGLYDCRSLLEIDSRIHRMKTRQHLSEGDAPTTGDVNFGFVKLRTIPRSKTLCPTGFQTWTTTFEPSVNGSRSSCTSPSDTKIVDGTGTILLRHVHTPWWSFFPNFRSALFRTLWRQSVRFSRHLECVPWQNRMDSEEAIQLTS